MYYRGQLNPVDGLTGTDVDYAGLRTIAAAREVKCAYVHRAALPRRSFLVALAAFAIFHVPLRKPTSSTMLRSLDFAQSGWRDVSEWECSGGKACRVEQALGERILTWFAPYT